MPQVELIGIASELIHETSWSLTWFSITTSLTAASMNFYCVSISKGLFFFLSINGTQTMLLSLSYEQNSSGCT